MTNGDVCPDPLQLSQFLDHELEEKDASRIAHHLLQCSDCRDQVERSRHLDGIVRAQVPSAESLLSLSTKFSECPALEKVVAYMEKRLPVTEEQGVEQHIQDCDLCFREAKDAARTQVFLTSLQGASVPVSHPIPRAPEGARLEAAEVSAPRLVLQLVAQGLQLISAYLAPPLLSVREVRVPLSSFRRGEHSSGLNLRLETGETQIDVLATPEDEGVAVRLTLLGPERQALADRRIFIRQQGRAVFSAQTNQQGELHVPRLESGSYEVCCQEGPPTFHLDLRP